MHLRHTRKNFVWSLILVTMISGGVFSSIGTQAHATSLSQSNSWIIPLHRADFKVLNLTVSQWACFIWPSYLSGYRNLTFSYSVKNIWQINAPYFLSYVTSQSGNVFGAGDMTILAPGENHPMTLWGILMGTRFYYFTLTIYPMNSQFIPGAPQNPFDYFNRLLDSNPANNIATTKIYLDPCPSSK